MRRASRRDQQLQKKIRWIVQYPAINAITIESGFTAYFLYPLLLLSGMMKNRNTDKITMICPISTPALNERIEVKNLFLGKPISFSELAKPIPCIRPNIKTIRTRHGFNWVNNIFSTATNKMEREMIGSTTAPGAMIMLFMLNASVMECATVNAVACQRMVLILVLRRQRLTTKSIWSKPSGMI